MDLLMSWLYGTHGLDVCLLAPDLVEILIYYLSRPEWLEAIILLSIAVSCLGSSKASWNCIYRVRLSRVDVDSMVSWFTGFRKYRHTCRLASIVYSEYIRTRSLELIQTHRQSY